MTETPTEQTAEAAPLTARELALVAAIGKLDAEDRKTMYAQVGTALEAMMRAEHARTGTRSIDVTLPDGTKVADFTMPSPAAAKPVIRNKEAFEEWVEGNAPAGTIEIVTQVRDSYKELLFHDLCLWVDDPDWVAPDDDPTAKAPYKVPMVKATSAIVPGVYLPPASTIPDPPRINWVKPSRAKGRVQTEDAVEGRDRVRGFLGSTDLRDMLVGRTLPELED